MTPPLAVAARSTSSTVVVVRNMLVEVQQPRSMAEPRLANLVEPRSSFPAEAKTPRGVGYLQQNNIKLVKKKAVALNNNTVEKQLQI